MKRKRRINFIRGMRLNLSTYDAAVIISSLGYSIVYVGKFCSRHYISYKYAIRNKIKLNQERKVREIK